MLPNVGMGELIVILGIILLLFGPKRLPEVAKGLGKSIKAFKNALHEGVSEDHESKSPSEQIGMKEQK